MLGARGRKKMTGSVETGKKTIGMWGRVEAKLELQNYNENKTRLKHTKHRTWKKKASEYQDFHVYAGSAQNDVKAPSQLITSVKTNCLHRFITLNTATCPKVRPTSSVHTQIQHGKSTQKPETLHSLSKSRSTYTSTGSTTKANWSNNARSADCHCEKQQLQIIAVQKIY